MCVQYECECVFMFGLMCVQYYYCLCMSDEDQGSRAGVHSISDRLSVLYLFVCMELNLFL